MEKANLFRLTFIGLVVIHFFNIAEQSFGKFTVWVHKLITKFHNKFDFPDFAINDATIMMLLLVVLIILIVVGTLVFLEIKWSWKLALIIAFFDFLYGIAHFTAGIYFRTYFPGMVSATLMIMLSVLVLYFYYLMMNPLKKENVTGNKV